MNRYIAIQVEENGKYYAYMIKVTPADNLVSKLNIGGIISANIHTTKKHCEYVVKLWNDNFKQQGKFLFNEIKF